MVDNKEIGQGDTTHYRASSYLKISTYCHMILDVMCFWWLAYYMYVSTFLLSYDYV